MTDQRTPTHADEDASYAQVLEYIRANRDRYTSAAIRRQLITAHRRPMARTARGPASSHGDRAAAALSIPIVVLLAMTTFCPQFSA